jgi:multidrug resistance efflux pump
MPLIEQVPVFVRKQGGKIALSLLVAMGFTLSLISPISQAVARRSPVSKATLLPATIRPHKVVMINSKFPGQVTALDVSTGKDVKAGDPLMTLRDSEFEMEYERARVHLNAVKRRLEARSIIGPTVDGSQVEPALIAAKERLAGFSINAVQASSEKTQSRLRQVERLVQAGVATESELDDARRAANIALRDLQSEREHLSRLKEEVEIAASRVGDSHRLRQHPVNTEQLNLMMELQEAQTALDIASQRRDSQQIVSTADGTVLKVLVSMGDQIPSGVPLVQIGQLERLDFDVPVGAFIARRLHIGQSVKVRVPTEPPTRIAAPIAAISLVPSQDQSAYTVRITTINPAPSSILVGLAAEVEFPQ